MSKVIRNHCRDRTMNLFAYGTLMSSEIMKDVSGLKPACLSALLHGYSRRCVSGQHYPGIIREEGASVEGMVYLDIPNWAWERLDAFEGEMYNRHQVTIHTEDKGLLLAETYVVKDIYAHYLENRLWSYEEFMKRGKAAFKRNYKGYSDLRRS